MKIGLTDSALEILYFQRITTLLILLKFLAVSSIIKESQGGIMKARELNLNVLRLCVEGNNFTQLLPGMMANEKQSRQNFLSNEGSLLIACQAFIGIVDNLNLDQDYNGELRTKLKDFAEALEEKGSVAIVNLLKVFEDCLKRNQ